MLIVTVCGNSCGIATLLQCSFRSWNKDPSLPALLLVFLGGGNGFKKTYISNKDYLT